MATNDSDDLLKLIARLYYVDGLGQADVAQFAKVSQAKISRLLSLARERGIVTIQVQDYEPRNRALEDHLCQSLKLHEVAVIKTAAGSRVEEARRAVGHFGASFVHDRIPKHATVAIAGGRSIRELVRMLPNTPKDGLQVVQAMGNIDASVGPVDALELAREMSQKYDARFMTIPTPAFVPDRKTRDAFLSLPQLRAVWKMFDQVNYAMVGVGTPENSIFSEHGLITPDEVKRLKAQGVVGEIFGRFYDKNGEECSTDWQDRVLSLELNRLKAIPSVTGVVAGKDRAAPLLAAIRGGLLKTLVIDEEGAQALLTKAKSNK